MAAVEYSHVYYASAHSPIRKGHKEWNKKKKQEKKNTLWLNPQNCLTLNQYLIQMVMVLLQTEQKC